jgi:ribosomal-protein-alanine N-acetyltransferase
MKHISTKKDSTVSFDECDEFINKCIAYYKNHPGLGIWATIQKENNKFIGWTTLKHLDKTEIIEVGYRYLKDYWGKGYATEASKALLDYGFETINLNSIAAVALPQNKASTRVMEKIGMKYVGIKHYYNVDVAFFKIDK